MEDVLSIKNQEEEFYKDTPLDVSYGSEFVIHCSFIYPDNDGSNNIDNNDPLPIENETFIKLTEEPPVNSLEKNETQETSSENKNDKTLNKGADESSPKEEKNCTKEVLQDHNLNYPNFIPLELKCDPLPEKDDSNKKRIFGTSVKETGIKRPFSDSAGTANKIKKRRCEDSGSSSSSQQVVPHSTRSKKYQGPFFYPHDHQNDTNPMWSKYKSKEFSPFEMVQNDWKNATLSDPHVNLSHMEGKRSQNNSNRRKCAHVRRVYDYEISRLLQAKNDILYEMSQPSQKFYQKNKLYPRRLSKIKEDLAVYLSAKEQLEYLLSNYHNEQFDALFVSQCELDEICAEKAKINTYEEFYGRSD